MSFKRPEDILEKTRSLLKNKASRQLLSRIKTEFPTLNDEKIARFFPPKFKITKVTLQNRGCLYLGESIVQGGSDTPYFFELDREPLLFPSSL